MAVGSLEVLLHVANTGSIDSRRLQMYNIRTLCALVWTSVALHLKDREVVVNRCGRDMRLCGVRPAGDSWRSVERTLWKYADLHQTENNHGVLLESSL